MQALKCSRLIPEFQPVTDPKRMKVAFEHYLPAVSKGHFAIKRCTVLYARHKTKTKPHLRDRSYIAVCYQLEVHDKVRKQNLRKILHCKAYLGGRSRAAFEAVREARHEVTTFGAAVVHIPQLDMVVWTFPNDAQMPHLWKVTDTERVKRYFPYDCLPAGLDGPTDLLNVKVEVKRYIPGERSVIRYELQWDALDAPRKLVLFGKTFAGDEGQTIYDRIRYLWGRSTEHSESFAVARPVGYSDGVRTLWQFGTEGVPVATFIGRDDCHHMCDAIGKGLANLHKYRIGDLKPISMEEHVDVVNDKAGELACHFPELQNRLRTILHGIDANRRKFDPTPIATVHRDFQIDQLQAYEGRICCFDFDDLAWGDPAEDLARFVVHLHFGRLDAPLAKTIATRVLQSYRERVEWEIATDRLNWHMQIQLLRKAYREYIQQRPGFRDSVQDIVSRVSTRTLV